MTNISRRACNTKLADVDTQDVGAPFQNVPSASNRPAPPPPSPIAHALGTISTGRPKVFDGTFAVDTNLYGSDYRNVALNDNFPSTCRDLCQKDAPCKAWIWVKPGVQNLKAMCWLKNSIPAPSQDANKTSGVKISGDLGVH